MHDSSQGASPSSTQATDQPDECADSFAVTYWPDDSPHNLRGKPQHSRNCGGNAYTPLSSGDLNCTCGLRVRVALETERTMHKAWRKRAEEAEAALLKRESSKLNDTEIREAIEIMASAHSPRTME